MISNVDLQHAGENACLVLLDRSHDINHALAPPEMFMRSGMFSQAGVTRCEGMFGSWASPRQMAAISASVFNDERLVVCRCDERTRVTCTRRHTRRSSARQPRPASQPVSRIGRKLRAAVPCTVAAPAHPCLISLVSPAQLVHQQISLPALDEGNLSVPRTHTVVT